MAALPSAILGAQSLTSTDDELLVRMRTPLV